MEFDIIMISKGVTDMGQIVVRQLEDAVLEAVKSRAKANNRSTEAEVRDIISNAVELPDQTGLRTRKRLSELVGSVSSGRTAEEIVAEIRVLRDEWED
ncbi:FitA-like ribbon-helix-helix domain-containing protein [Hoeflea ulvae]|uniref:Antitoxin FitA-like ribbon-helix-helix domain-containing protein n=1 Tax=Hoeflea ulvae TaxID=2983764 RepID=A0ABT3YJI4_9HYPH|nr:hypothetical protein [Hoeflea ulvae]MCY0095939.1 hypothetical protein [Hoeflea ulvae]